MTTIKDIFVNGDKHSLFMSVFHGGHLKVLKLQGQVFGVVPSARGIIRGRDRNSVATVPRNSWYWSTPSSGWWYTYPFEKYESVSWDYYSKYKIKYDSNHQPVFRFLVFFSSAMPWSAGLSGLSVSTILSFKHTAGQFPTAISNNKQKVWKSKTSHHLSQRPVSNRSIDIKYGACFFWWFLSPTECLETPRSSMVFLRSPGRETVPSCRPAPERWFPPPNPVDGCWIGKLPFEVSNHDCWGNIALNLLNKPWVYSSPRPQCTSKTPMGWSEAPKALPALWVSTCSAARLARALGRWVRCWSPTPRRGPASRRPLCPKTWEKSHRETQGKHGEFGGMMGVDIWGYDVSIQYTVYSIHMYTW